MPYCFRLYRKSEVIHNQEAQKFTCVVKPLEPVALQKVDEEICQMLGVPVDPKYYHQSWYDIIGLYLALGKSFEWIIEEVQDTTLHEIAVWLNDNFTPYAWYEHKSMTN